MSRLLRSMLLVVTVMVWGTTAQAAPDGPVVRMPGLEQGSSVRGDVLVDVILRPADDGVPLLKADLSIDDVPLITYDLQPSMRNLTFRWSTTDPQWGDGKHQIVAKVLDAKGREGVYRTFVYVWNQGRPTAAKQPASLDIQDTDGAPDNVITQKAVIHVKVDPELGAKWVLIYINDQLLAMINYPPYQATLDPASRHMDDGPVVVRAKVIHPDSSETNVQPSKLEINLSGRHTGIGPAGVTPGATPAVSPMTPVVRDNPGLTVAPLPTETPGAASTSVDVAAATPPVTVGADRPSSPRAVQPGVIDGGAVEMSLPGATLPAGAATTVPVGPDMTLGPGGKPSATRTKVMGPLQPARAEAGVSGTSAAMNKSSLPTVNAASGSQVQVTALPSSTRLAAPRSGVGSSSTMRAPMAEPGLTGGSPRDAIGVTRMPSGTRLDAPQTGTGVSAPAPILPSVQPPTALETTATRDSAVVVTPGRATAPAMTRTAPLPLGTVAGEPVTAPRRTGAQPAVKLPAVSATPAPRVATVSIKTGHVGRLHTVARGDTVYRLARKYGVSADALARVNNLKNVNLIRIGQKLVIPGGVMKVDGENVKTDVPAVEMRNGIAASPFRYVVEALGGTVSWVGPAQQVVANTADRGVITISVGSKTAQVNEEQVLMDLAAYLEHGRTMVPVRFISSALDVTIEMDDSSGNILIKSNR